MRITPSRAARLAGLINLSPAIECIEVHTDRIEVKAKGQTRSIPITAIQECTLNRGLIWDRLTLRATTSDSPFEFRWMAKADAQTLHWFIYETATIRDFEQAYITTDATIAGPLYFRRSLLDRLHQTLTRLHERLPPRFHELPITSETRKRIIDARAFLSHCETIRNPHNSAFVAQMASRHAHWFAQCMGRPLNSGQIEAILHEDDNCLAVAGAGTGKTTTVAAKVAYLVLHRCVPPERILLLAFTAKAKHEIAQRLSRFTACKDVAIHTFHSLGLHILAQAQRLKPTVSKLAQDPRAFQQLISSWLGDLLRAEASALKAIDFFLFHATPPPVDNEPSSLRSIAGHLVKSYEELLISNWLCLHGIQHEYECNYEHPTATEDHPQYRPDFYLPDHGIYIEHFGVDRHGNTRHDIKAERYLEGMQWKREVHKHYGTRLIETFSFENREGSLLAGLDAKLRALGVQPHRRPNEEIIAAIAKQPMMPRVAILLTRFLTLHKASGKQIDLLRKNAKQSALTARSIAFLDLFHSVLEKYEDTLSSAGEIDFNDMILDAAESAQQGAYRSPYSHIIVDEFQDISHARKHLLSSLLNQNKERELFCVGDDWQSIYRFTGADIGIMTGFESHFGPTHLTTLCETYRFNERLLNASSKFILQNPEQIPKTLTAKTRSDKAAIHLVPTPYSNAVITLSRILQEIAAESPSGAEVLVMARYKFRLPSTLPINNSQRLSTRLCTIHTAKGQEADYAIVLAVDAGRYGFPAELEDDPLFELVLARPSGMPHAEERRLFYVAMTRARIRTYIMADESHPSAFIKELTTDQYIGLVDKRGFECIVECPTCRAASLVRSRRNPAYWTCSNHLRCKEKFRSCSLCNKAPIMRTGGKLRCSDRDCPSHLFS